MRRADHPSRASVLANQARTGHWRTCHASGSKTITLDWSLYSAAPRTSSACAMSLLDTFPASALLERVPLGPMLAKQPKVATPKSVTLKRDHSPGPAQSERKRARTENNGERDRERARLEADKFRKEWRRKFDGLVLFFDEALPHAREEFAERIFNLKGVRQHIWF